MMRVPLRFFLLVLTALTLAGLLGASALKARAAAREDAVRTRMVLSIVNGIIHYTRWPNLGGKLEVCLIGESDYFSLFDRLSAPIQEVVGVPATFVRIKKPEEAVSQCNLIYVGRWKEYDTRQLLSTLAGQPILSIGEEREFCSMGGMFCLDLNDPGEVHFSTNLDAISRSKVRVNPQVLRLAERLKAATP